MSQKGGVEFKDGKVSGGPGLELLVDLVTSDDIATENLKNTFAHPSWSWQDTIANYLGAIVADNTEAIKDLDSRYEVQEPVKAVTDLQGTKNKTFGMRFSNFLTLGDVIAEGFIEELSADEGKTTKTLSVYTYQSKPVRYTVKSAEDSLEITLENDPLEGVGAAVAILRVK